MSLADVEEFLAAEVTEGLFATGGQLYASVGGEVVSDLALGVDGVGASVKRDSLFSVYCAAKPVFTAALGCLIDEGELSLDDQVGHVVEEPLPHVLSSLVVGDLLNHTAGLHQLDTYTYLGSSGMAQRELVCADKPPLGWRVGNDVAYIQVTGWELLGRAVEDLTGDPVNVWVRKRVIDPMGLSGDVFVGGMTEEQFALHRERVRVNVHLAGTEGVPMLTELNRRFRCLVSPAAGSTANARGLGRFYEGLLRGLADGEVVSSGCLGMLTSLQSHGLDAVMGRECGYGYGFMVQLADHDYGRWCSSRSFGHSGYGGMSAAFCDPEFDLVVAFHFNGRVDAASAIGYRRRALVEWLYRAVLDVV